MQEIHPLLSTLLSFPFLHSFQDPQQQISPQKKKKYYGSLTD